MTKKEFDNIKEINIPDKGNFYTMSQNEIKKLYNKYKNDPSKIQHSSISLGFLVHYELKSKTFHKIIIS